VAKESENNQSIETKKSKLKTYVTLLAIVCIICLGGLSYTCYYLFDKAVFLDKKLSDSVVAVERCIDLAEVQKVDLEMATVELAQTKARMEGIKDKDDLLKRDIELYITHRYRKIPNSVAKTIAHTVVDMTKKEDISAELVVGIIEVESGFNPTITGVKTKYGHARGLMQLMPEWAPKFKLKSKFDFHDIDINIASGIKVFKIHLKEGKGKISEGLYFYVNKDRSYVDKVYRAMGKFVSFRSTIDDDEKTENGFDEKEKDVKNGTDTGTAKSS
jgi:hypothetical protein